MDNEKGTVLFSIIVPVYGVEAFLPQAIESVLAQSVSDWELILVDDGSPDGCGEICDHYAALDARIRVIHKENGGLVSARQAGIVQCKGDYIMNLDGDDYWDSDLLAKIQSVILQYHPDCVSFGFRQVTEDNVTIGEKHPPTQSGYYCGEALKKLRSLLLYNPNKPDFNNGAIYFGIVLSAFRREIVAPMQQLVPQHIRWGEDASVTIPSILQCNSIYVLDVTQYNYRIRRSSISSSFSLSRLRETELLYHHLKEYASQLPSLNLGCFLYRQMESIWIGAARSMPSYREFRAFVATSLDVISEDIVGCISQCPLKTKYRLRIFVVKHNLWFILWLFYHRN